MATFLEFYHQTYTYDVGNNLTYLSHQAKSNTWQQSINIYPSSNQGTETKPPVTDFDANGNLLTLNNIGTLTWHYNNSLNKLIKDDKTTEYYIYDRQGTRTRTVTESNQQKQSQRDYLPALDILTTTQQSITLHIGTHILSETTNNTSKTRYQLKSHLQSSTLELNDKAQVISYEHYYPYGGTALIAGKTQPQVAQKRYRYTGKETDDNSGLSYYGARYLASWMARWISPDLAGAVDGLNLYVYVGNNPLKYSDLTGYVKVTSLGKKFEDYEIDVLSPVEETYHNDNLFYFPEAYQRLEKAVRNYSRDELELLNTKTIFTVMSQERTMSSLQIGVRTSLGGNYFINTMNFSKGELKFEDNRRIKNFVMNATQIISYQYLGMTKIAGALNLLPKYFSRKGVINPGAMDIINTYQDDRDMLRFRHDFIRCSANGKSSSRIANAFGLKITAIELKGAMEPKRAVRSVRLHLRQQETLRPIGEPFILPPQEKYAFPSITTRPQRKRSATL